MSTSTEPTITVCNACMRACCWHGMFMCDEARCAGITELTREQLVELGLESSEYWTQEGIERFATMMSRYSIPDY